MACTGAGDDPAGPFVWRLSTKGHFEIVRAGGLPHRRSLPVMPSGGRTCDCKGQAEADLHPERSQSASYRRRSRLPTRDAEILYWRVGATVMKMARSLPSRLNRPGGTL